MKTENTPEAKARFFAPFMVDGSTFTLTKESYYDTSDPREGMGIGVKNAGFTFEFNWEITRNAFRYGNGKFPYKFIERSAVELTPLSQISDEDAIELTKIEGEEFESAVGRGRNIAEWISNGSYYLRSIRKCIAFVDFLRSRGYYVGDGTEVTYGWAVLKGEEKS